MTRAPARGAALLLAMLVLMLVATLASGMLWQQSRSLQVEEAERARAQSTWILAGARDWARMILREDLRRPAGAEPPAGVDWLNAPWATALAEARLSTFLAVDKDNNSDSGPDAFLSGRIVDAQSRWNLRNLFDDAGKEVPVELAALQRLCNLANLPADTAPRIVEGLRGAWGQGAGADDTGLAPGRIADLDWLGLDPSVVERLTPWVEVLPLRTTVNVNTAPREVLVAAIDGLDVGSAERLVQARQRKAFANLEAVKAALPSNLTPDAARIGVGSSWFLVTGRLRLDDRVLEERSLVRRGGDVNAEVQVMRRERLSLAAGTTRSGAP